MVGYTVSVRPGSSDPFYILTYYKNGSLLPGHTLMGGPNAAKVPILPDSFGSPWISKGDPKTGDPPYLRPWP